MCRASPHGRFAWPLIFDCFLLVRCCLPCHQDGDSLRSSALFHACQKLLGGLILEIQIPQAIVSTSWYIPCVLPHLWGRADGSQCPTHPSKSARACGSRFQDLFVLLSLADDGACLAAGPVRRSPRSGGLPRWQSAGLCCLAGAGRVALASGGPQPGCPEGPRRW